jgi:hypothetical protein
MATKTAPMLVFKYCVYNLISTKETTNAKLRFASLFPAFAMNAARNWQYKKLTLYGLGRFSSLTI